MDGRAQDALDATGEAERHLAFLAEAEPTDHQSRLESGRVEELRALTLRSLDRPAEALEATDRGLALIDALIVESPGHPEYRRVRIGLLEQRCRAAAKLGDSRLLNSAAQSMFREADRWDQAHPGDVDWTARRMALGAQFANAALGPLLAGPEGDALVVQTRLFVEDLDRAPRPLAEPGRLRGARRGPGPGPRGHRRPARRRRLIAATAARPPIP
jgi:hypothetical protein